MPIGNSETPRDYSAYGRPDSERILQSSIPGAKQPEGLSMELGIAEALRKFGKVVLDALANLKRN